MPTIDLSKIFDSEGNHQTAGINVKAFVNAALKPQFDIIDGIEKDTNDLSKYAKAFSDLQQHLLNINNMIEYPSGVNNSIKQREALINGEKRNSNISVSAEPNASVQSFNIGDIEIAHAKRMISPSFKDATTKLSEIPGISTGHFYISKPSDLSTVIHKLEIKKDLGQRIFDGNAHNLIANIQKYSAYDDFLGNHPPQNVRIDTISASNAIISLTMNGTKYTSDPIDSNPNMIFGNQLITFRSQSSDMHFNLGLRDDIDIDSAEKKNLACDKIAIDLSILEIALNKNISNFQPNGVLSAVKTTDISYISYDSDRNISTSTFSVTPPNLENSGSISVEINGEKFTAKGLGSRLSGIIILNSSDTNQSLMLNLGNSGTEIPITDSHFAKLFENSLNKAFNLKTGSEILLDADDTLETLSTKINKESLSSGVKSQVLQVDRNDFRLILNSTETGLKNTFVITGNDFTKDFSTTKAQDASFLFSGIRTKRSTNHISDLTKNITIDLLSDTPGQDFQIDIQPNKEAILRSVEDLMLAFNKFQEFSAQQKETNDNGSFAESAVLQGNYILGSINNKLIDTALKKYGNNKYLSEIGIAVKITAQENLKFNVISQDQDKFISSMQKDPEGSLNLLAEFTNSVRDIIYESTNGRSILQKEVQNLSMQSKRNIDRIERIREQIETERSRLINKYSILEQTIMRTNSVIEILKAQQEASNSK